jgi:cell wall-associated NlpC family hydrolase
MVHARLRTCVRLLCAGAALPAVLLGPMSGGSASARVLDDSAASTPGTASLATSSTSSSLSRATTTPSTSTTSTSTTTPSAPSTTTPTPPTSSTASTSPPSTSSTTTPQTTAPPATAPPPAPPTTPPAPPARPTATTTAPRAAAPNQGGTAGDRSNPAPTNPAPTTPAPAGGAGDLGSALTQGATAATTGYAPPVPAALLTANPAWLGEVSTPAGAPVPAGAVALPVPAGTPVSAVTGGTAQVAGSSVTLTGGDGATYTTTGVQPAAGLAPGTKVTAGQPLGTAAPGGVAFSIAIPDVAGPVCADGALQSWAAGTATDVHSLPTTCLAGTSAVPAAPVHVLVATDGKAGALAPDLADQFAGTDVTVGTASLDPAASPAAEAAALQAAEPTPAQLLVLALPDATPATAAALVPLLPAGQQVLWVAAPSTDPATAAAYQALVTAHPGLRVESPPAALATLTAPTGPWAGVLPQVVAMLAARYAGTAYRLPTTSARTAQVLSYAEAQLGKPYQWAGAGPVTFDCSGLTMRAYAAAGVTMPHNAYAQYEQTKASAVPEDQLQPGDLVFFGPSVPGIEHVGIYTGGGTFLDAPDTGSFVRFDHLGPGWDYQGATRPLGLAGRHPLAAVGRSAIAAGGLPATAPGAATADAGPDQAFAQALAAATWGATQFPFLQALWQRESGWNPTAANPISGAYGIPQALPASKMASVSTDWATDPFTQILWGVGYIQSTYGTAQAAWAHEVAYGWY